MATTLVENQLGSLVKRFRLPADVKTALAFCKTALDGVYRVYAKTSEQGDINESEVILVKVLLRDKETGRHFYLQFYAKPTVTSSDEIKAILSGWTGVDEIFVLDFRRMRFNPSGE